MFKEIHTKFEKKETDLYELQQIDQFSRYILIRSLSNDHLKKLITNTVRVPIISGKSESLYEQVFSSSISNDQIILFINKEYPRVKEHRMQQEAHLPNIIEQFGDVECGIRNDNLNDTAKNLVRDKTIETKEILDQRIDSLLEGTIKG